MLQLFATRCSCIAILCVILVSFAAIMICVASQRMFIVVSVYFVIDSVRKRLDTLSYGVGLVFEKALDWIPTVATYLKIKIIKYVSICVGLIPQPRGPTKCLWIEKSIKEGQGPIRTVEASGGEKNICQYNTTDHLKTAVRANSESQIYLGQCPT
jgi:hypothetical protein